VRDPADRELHEETVVPEDFVLEEDLLHHLLGRSDEVRFPAANLGMEFLAVLAPDPALSSL
jgi:hypothetical protein